MKRHYYKVLWICLLFGLFLTPILVYGLRFYQIRNTPAETSQIPKITMPAVVEPVVEAAAIIAAPVKTAPVKATLPASYLIENMPFAIQSPFNIWDALHEDACEEASLILVERYRTSKAITSKQDMDDEIRRLVAFEETGGYGLSITVSELNDIASAYYGMTTGRVEVATKANIQAEIAAGRPVIVPAAGKFLDNPYFKNGGPIYHMFVIKGYDETAFIANDVGIGRGQGYRYPYDIVPAAIHDWNKDDITKGEKLYLVFD